MNQKSEKVDFSVCFWHIRCHFVRKFVNVRRHITPKENKMIRVMGDIYDQIVRQDLLRKDI